MLGGGLYVDHRVGQKHDGEIEQMEIKQSTIAIKHNEQ